MCVCVCVCVNVCVCEKLTIKALGLGARGAPRVVVAMQEGATLGQTWSVVMVTGHLGNGEGACYYEEQSLRRIKGTTTKSYVVLRVKNNQPRPKLKCDDFSYSDPRYSQSLARAHTHRDWDE